MVHCPANEDIPLSSSRTGLVPFNMIIKIEKGARIEFIMFVKGRL